MPRPAKDIVLRPVRPNAGLEALYRRKLDLLIAQMHDSVMFWITAAWLSNQPVLLAEDAGIPGEMAEILKDLVARATRSKDGVAFVDLPSGARLFAARGKKGTKPSYRITYPGEKFSKPLPRAKVEAVVEEHMVTAAGAHLGIADVLGTPADELRAAVQKMTAMWQKNFDEAAPQLAEYFGTSVAERSDAVLRSVLRNGGYSVSFSMTPAATDVMQATIGAQVGLIKSIPQQYLTQVEGAVMRSVQAGRDLGSLAKELQQQFGVTKRRAALIARDQNNKATASITRVRQVELGITEAVWRHSTGGKHLRPKHVAASGKRYDVTKGLPIGDQGQWVFPGEEINCRCVSCSVVPGLS